MRLGLHGCNRPAQQISPTCGLPREPNFLCLPVLHCVAAASDAARPTLTLWFTDKDAMGAILQPRKENIMANIGTFTADKDGFTGTLRTLTLNVKVKFIQNDKTSENAPDYRIQAANGLEVGAAWKKISQAERPYVSVSLDDPSFPATVYARLIEGEDGTHNLIWSRSKGD